MGRKVASDFGDAIVSSPIAVLMSLCVLGSMDVAAVVCERESEQEVYLL